MDEETPDELFGCHGAALWVPGLSVAIAERQLASFKALDASVRDRGPEEIATEVLDERVARSRVLDMNDPVLLPSLLGHGVVEACGLEGIAELGTEDRRENTTRHEEAGVARLAPPESILCEASRGHEEVGVRVVAEIPGPGMKDSDHAWLSAEMAGVLGKLLDGLGRTAEQKIVDLLLMRPCQRTERLGQGEGEQEVVTREASLLLGLGPSLASISLTGGAVSVSAGVVGVLGLLAVGAEIEVSTECRGAALLDVAHGAQVRGKHAVAKAIAIRPSVLAEDVRDYEHEGGAEGLCV